MPLPKRPAKQTDEITTSILPSIEDDVFTPVNNEVVEHIPEQAERKIVKKPKKKIRKESLEPFLEHTNTEEDGIDYDKERIVPTGNKKTKKKKQTIKDSDIDKRHNKMVGIKIARLFTYLVLVVLVGLGIKAVYFPEQIYTKEEIELIAYNAVGRTGFPIEKGRALASEYLFHYLNASKDPYAKQLLGKFYSGKPVAETSAGADGRTLTESNKQVPVNYPILFDEVIVDSASARFSYSVYVSNSDGNIANEKREFTGSWLSFAVNVYYDKAKDSVSIVEQPNLIPTYVVRQPDVAPQKKPLGNGTVDQNATNKLQSTVVGFVKAYSNSSVDNHQEVDQYIPAEKPVELLSGFGGTVKLTGENAIAFTTYKTDDPKEWKIDIVVQWTNQQVTPIESAISYSSHYVMTVRETENGTYLVTRFVPYTFVADTAPQ